MYVSVTVIMLSFCKKSVHSILGGLTNYPMSGGGVDDFNAGKVSCICQGVCSLQVPGGLGLITAGGDVDIRRKTPNVLESANVKSSPPYSAVPALSSSSSTLPEPFKKDPGGIGFIDDVGGGVDGLMSCTESLGFESSDERRVGDELELCSRETKLKWIRKGGGRREVRKFPPPLSSLNHNGQPSFFLRPVRRDGRLELTEVRLDRPEILRASRQDGRLTLHLIRDEEFDINYEEEEELEEQEQEEIESEKKKIETIDDTEEDEEQETKEDWGFAVTGEACRRCNDMVVVSSHRHDYHNNHHNLHAWSQYCVSTR